MSHSSVRNAPPILARCAAIVAALGVVSVVAQARPAALQSSLACTLVVNAVTGATVTRVGDRCDDRATPASTFKIVLSLAGFDSGILLDDGRPAWPYREEYRAWNNLWKQTITPRSWLRDSVVWYSQVLTRRMGMAMLQKYVDTLGYGNRDLSGDPGQNNGLTNAWLASSLQISPAEQVTFMQRMIRSQLPVSRSALEHTKTLMPVAEVAGWQLRGKTGTGYRRSANGTYDQERQIGWFVGWAQRAGETFVFARLIEDEGPPQDVRAGLRARDSLLADWASLVAARPSQIAPPVGNPMIGLDHIPFVVRDLPAAAATYRRLGFALKTGRFHDNGITNTHIKFEDGAGIELITAPAAVDDLTTQYRALMDVAEGPVFFGLHARQTDRFTGAMARAGIPFDEGEGRIKARELNYVFVGRDNRSLTDRPEHFAHRNGATALVRVWLAPDQPAVLRQFLEAAGGSTTTRMMLAPLRVSATVVRVSNGEIVILPSERRVTPRRPIVGVTFGVASLAATARYLAGAGIQVDASADADGTRRFLIPPTETRGMWIEFREHR